MTAYYYVRGRAVTNFVRTCGPTSLHDLYAIKYDKTIYRTTLKRIMRDYLKHKIAGLGFETVKTSVRVKTKKINIVIDIIRSVAL